jgi:hypothetical protein
VLERDAELQLEDDVHMTLELGPPEGGESEGHLEARVKIAPNRWEWIGALLVYSGLRSPPPPPPVLLPAVAPEPVRGRTALDRLGQARGAAQPVAVMLTANAAFGTAAIDALTAAVQVAPAGASRYTVTPVGRPAFVVRLEACALGSRVVRAQINPSKTHVLQISSSADDTEIPRALASGLAEIAEVVRIASIGADPDRSDLLRPGGVAPVLSPHDRGSVAELEALSRAANAAVGPVQRQQAYARLHQLIDDLGLRATDPASAGRRAAFAAGLTPTATHWLNTLALDPVALGPNTGPAYMAAKVDEEAAEVSDRRDKAREAPLHQTPRQGAYINADGARRLADLAATRRRAKSEQMVLKYQNLVAVAAPGYHRVESPQIGGGATLSAVRPGQLLIDDAGRWQRDPSANLAQTAAQLHWVREAGLGDPFEFVDGPNDRVPLAAVRYWQDTIAAQADLIDGRASTTVDVQGRLILRVIPTAGAQLAFEVGGNAVIGTGFPPENIPRPRAPLPAPAKATLLAELTNLGTPAALGLHARLVPVDPTNDTQVMAFTASPDPGGVFALLRAPGGPAEAAMRVFDAPGSWATHHDPAAHQPRVLTGDEANTRTIDPAAAAHWVITGVGGTGISAAEIILDGNPIARVTMIGGNATAGLFDNVQARRVMARYGPTGQRRFQVVTGQDIGELRTPDGGGTFDVGGPITGQGHLTAAPAAPALLPNHRKWLVDADPLLLPAVRALAARDVIAEANHVGAAPYQRVLITLVGPQITDQLRDDPALEQLLQDYGPVSGTIRFQVATGGGYGAVAAAGAGFATGELNVDGYISAIGRRGQSAPMITSLLASANAAGHAIGHFLLWDANGQYIGYRIAITAVGQPPRNVDVTGAASRFLPIPPFGVVDQNLVTQAGTLDAPPESGNFDGGFSASALQSQNYARQRRQDTEHTQLTTLHLAGAMGTLTLAPGQPKPVWEQDTKAFLVRELRVPADRVEVKCLAAGASGDAVFRVTVGASQRIFKVFNGAQAQNEIAQLAVLANLHLVESQPVGFQPGQLPANVNGQANRNGILMEAADGTSIEDLMGKLPPAGPLRAPAIQRIEACSLRVADALAELHHVTTGPAVLSLAQKSGAGSAVADIRDRKLVGIQAELAPDYAAIRAAFLLCITGFENAVVPATAYHGDANAGNFIHNGGQVRIIDVGAMQWSHAAGVGNSTGANDLARFTTSLETLHPGALDAGEVTQIRNAFLARYYLRCAHHGLAANAANQDDAIKIFKVETEIAVMRGAITKLGPAPAPHLLAAAQNAGRDRIKGVLGL